MNQPVPVLEISMRTSPEADFTVDVPVGFDQVIGREASAGITVADTAVSRRHARVRHDESGVWVEDIGSTNGTFVNGERLIASRRLADRDVVTFGDCMARFHDLETPTGEVPVVGDTTAVVDNVAVVHTVAPPVDSAARCRGCGAPAAADRWFCGQCGEQLRPTPAPVWVGDPVDAGAGLGSLVTAHGTPRRFAFRRAMRTFNGGRAVRFNEGLAFPTIAFRLLIAILVIAAAIIAVAVAQGASLSTIGLGG